MKKELLLIIFFFLGIHLFAQKLTYKNCTGCWNPDSLGNHRVVLSVASPGKYARVNIPWRRRDEDPQNKRIIIEDAKTTQRILNVKAANLNRESDEIYLSSHPGRLLYIIIIK